MTRTSNLKHQSPCTAASKRSGQPCQQPACRGQSKCRFHGGMSTGPKTLRGRSRISRYRTRHGLQSVQSKQLDKLLKNIRMTVDQEYVEGLSSLSDKECVWKSYHRLDYLSGLACRSIIELEGVVPIALEVKHVNKAANLVLKIETMKMELLESSGVLEKSRVIRLARVLNKHAKHPNEFSKIEVEMFRFLMFGGLQCIFDNDGGYIRAQLNELMGDHGLLLLEEIILQINNDLRRRCGVSDVEWERLTPAQRSGEFDTQFISEIQDLQKSWQRITLPA